MTIWRPTLSALDSYFDQARPCYLSKWSMGLS